MAIEVGSIVEGVVTGITNFGAFVELPEKKVGLVHISEVADEYVQKIKVKVLSIDEKGKIGLSIKALEDKKAPHHDHVGNAGNHPGFHSSPRPQGGRGPRDFRRSGGVRFGGNPRMNASFEDKLSKFLKDSDERLTDLRRKTDSKRGGRGSRRD